MIRGILAGRHGPPRDIVVANAAAAVDGGRSASLTECAQAAEAIDSGARDLLARLVERTNGAITNVTIARRIRQ